MNYLRMYTSKNGESQIENVQADLSPVAYAPPAPSLEMSDGIKSSEYRFVRFEAGWDSKLHPTPRRQLFIVLSGVLEGGLSDGRTFLLNPGDVLLMEDTTGKGHTARPMNGTEVQAMVVVLD